VVDVHLHFVLAIRIDEDDLLGDRIGQDGSQGFKDILNLGVIRALRPFWTTHTQLIPPSSRTIFFIFSMFSESVAMPRVSPNPGVSIIVRFA